MQAPFGEFRYWADKHGGHLLMYYRVPSFDRRVYHFQKRRWFHLD